jgi:hypothetical protein
MTHVSAVNLSSLVRLDRRTGHANTSRAYLCETSYQAHPRATDSNAVPPA